MIASIMCWFWPDLTKIDCNCEKERRNIWHSRGPKGPMFWSLDRLGDCVNLLPWYLYSVSPRRTIIKEVATLSKYITVNTLGNSLETISFFVVDGCHDCEAIEGNCGEEEVKTLISSVKMLKFESIMSRLDNLSNDSWEALNFLGVGRITFFVAPGRKWQDSYFVFCCAGPGVTGGMGGAGGGASVIPRLINANTEGDNTLSGISSHS